MIEYEVQFHRHDGPDESFEADTLDAARALARSETTPGTYRIVIIDIETGRVVDEL